MGNDQKEVKELIETTYIEPAQDNEEVINEQETETPSVSSTEEKPAPSIEKPQLEQPKERVPQEQETVPENVPQESPEDKKEPKPVLGETLKERALRLEVQRMKAKLRETRKSDVLPPPHFGSAGNTSPTRPTGILEKYDPEELKNLKEVMGAFADEFGFVRKTELQTTTYNDTVSHILDEFLEKHSEYLPENDPENVLWGQFTEEVKLYRQPENPKDYKKILNRVHTSLSGISSEDSLAKIEAQKEKLKTASHVGSAPSKAPVKLKSPIKMDAALRAHLKGFSEEELQDLGL